MIKNVFNSIGYSARMLIRSWRVYTILILLYGGLLGSIYLFFATREASVGQVLLTFLLPIVALVLLFIIQVIAVRYVDAATEARKLLLGAFRDFWRLVVISLPLIVAIGLVIYLLWQIDLEPGQTASATGSPPRPGASLDQPLNWQAVALAAIRYLLLCLFLPVTLIHLWIEGSRSGLKSSFRNLWRVVGRSLLPQSVLTYLLGFVVFAAMPYILVFTKTSASSTAVEVGLFTVRLSLALLLSLAGWVATVGALSHQAGGTTSNANDAVTGAQEDAEHVPVES